MRHMSRLFRANFLERCTGELLRIHPLGRWVNRLLVRTVGFALPLCLSKSYDLVPGAPTSGVIPSNNPAHQEIYQTCVMIDPIL